MRMYTRLYSLPTVYTSKRVTTHTSRRPRNYGIGSFYANTHPYPLTFPRLSVPAPEQVPPAAAADDAPEDAPAAMPKGAVNRRRRVSVSAEVDNSKVNRVRTPMVKDILVLYGT